MAIPFAKQAPADAGALLIGQPFSMANLSMPVSCHFTCNCVPANPPMVIVNSSPVTCACCQKTYLVAFNPANGQIMVALAEATEKAGS